MKSKSRKQYFLRYIPFTTVVLLFLFLSIGVVPSFTYAQNVSLTHSVSTLCPTAKLPTNSSLLVIMFDRSGSVRMTDPDGYATSVTKALVDLWPGPIAVVPFSGDGPTVPILGPASVDFTPRTSLKNQIDQYPIGGHTPLNLAMRQALSLLHEASPGSRAIIITDGQPTGIGQEDTQHQEQDIWQNLIPQFCQRGIPVSAFGLMINTGTKQGQDADQLLTDINNGTAAGATYGHVENPEELASNIIGLYARWRNLNFSLLIPDTSGIYPLPIDAFVQHISVITFRANNSRNIGLLGPDGQAVQGVQISLPDRHYEIDSLTEIPPIVPVTYKVDAGSDADTQVYALITSPLRVQILSPTLNTMISNNQSIEIQAALFDEQNQLTPAQDEAQLRAYVTFLIGGKAAGHTDEIDLKQQGNIFINQTSRYTEVGVLRIEVRATYKGAKRETSITIPVQQSLIITPSQPPWSSYAAGLLVLGALIILLLLVGLSARVLRAKKGSRRLYVR